MWIKSHKRLVLTVCTYGLAAVVIGVTVFSIVSKENSYYGEYYLASVGNKYHEKNVFSSRTKPTPGDLQKKNSKTVIMSRAKSVCHRR